LLTGFLMAPPLSEANVSRTTTTPPHPSIE
jgi:hypothetical protein